MRVIACVVTEHNLWLVLLAALICVSGCWVTLGLFRRAGTTQGLQRSGWVFLTAVAAGSSVWCTHFVAMLAYDPRVPIAFDPLLTFTSLVIAVVGMGFGMGIASSRTGGYAPEVGGVFVGLSIAAMHYTGMMAYQVDGEVLWDKAHVLASVMIAVVLASAAISVIVRRPIPWANHLSLGLLVLAIVGLHFTAMAAVAVLPMPSGMAGTGSDVIETMAIAVAGVGLIIAGTGAACYLIDERTRFESLQTLQHLALNDSLTGLPNRACFAEYLDHELDRARQDGFKVGVVGIDLDRFKEINDLRGHSAGDAALKIIAQRLSRLLREGEFVARTGGDEFSAVKRFRDQKSLLDFIARLERSLFQPIRLDDFETVTGASLGVAVFPDDGSDRERLVSNADLAMYRAKTDVAQVVCFYETRMDEAARDRRNLANDLRRAIELGQLEPHYQVQTSVATGEIRGYEVLLRWTHPTRGRIPPSEFIPIAEENGMILSIGEWVLREACRQAASWSEPYKIAVNLSPVQLAHGDLAKLVFEVLLETGLLPSRLELEITESTIIADKIRTLHILRQIRALGVTIAIDDFGTGYSSLETLRSFPFDKIKLDRSFMSEVENSPQAKAIVRAVLALGKSLDIRVLAEGVETADQLAILRQEGCDEAQGYLLGRPRPVGQIFQSQEALYAEAGLPEFSGRLPLARLARRAAG